MTLKQRVVGKLRSNIALSWLSLDNYKHQERMVNIYDSLLIDVDDETQKAIRKVFNESRISFSLPKVQRQEGTHDCGLFAIAFATNLCFSHNPVAVSAMEYTQYAMRGHLINCLESAYFIDFP